MKEQVTICFRRLSSGEVRGEVINGRGEVVAYKTFGNLSDEEIKNVFEALQEEHPEVHVIPMIVADTN